MHMHKHTTIRKREVKPLWFEKTCDETTVAFVPGNSRTATAATIAAVFTIVCLISQSDPAMPNSKFERPGPGLSETAPDAVAIEPKCAHN